MKDKSALVATLLFMSLFWPSFVRAESSDSEGSYTVLLTKPEQVIQGLGVEIQSDGWGPDWINSDPVRGVPYVLNDSERKRLAANMLKGFRYLRLGMGIWYRGVTDDKKNFQERYAGQNDALLQMISEAGIEGISMEYWSPAPYWKTSGKLVGGVLKKYTPTFLSSFANAMVKDLQYLQNRGFKILTWGMQNEPLFTNTSYPACQYSARNYVNAFKYVAPRIREASPSTEIIVDSNDGNTGVIADELRTNNPDLLQYVDAWVYHRIGESSDLPMDSAEKLKVGAGEKPIYNNEYEYFSYNVKNYTANWRMVNTAQSLMNWMTFLNSPKWYWLHALKPADDTENGDGFGLGYYREKGMSDGGKGVGDGYWIYNTTNFNALAGFLKYMPWDSRRYDVKEDKVRKDQRIMCWKRPDGTFVIALTNRSDQSFTFKVHVSGAVTYTGHRYNINMRDIDLEKQSGSNLSTTLRPWSIEFWEVRSATGIKPVVTNKSNGYYYSIVGYKYDKRPTRRGVYIYNGKKIVIK